MIMIIKYNVYNIYRALETLLILHHFSYSPDDTCNDPEFDNKKRKYAFIMRCNYKSRLSNSCHLSCRRDYKKHYQVWVNI